MEAIKKLTSSASAAAWRLRKAALFFRSALLFSAGDERVSFGKDVCVIIEKSCVSVAYGTRLMSSVAVKGLKKYPFAEPAYPQPKEVASSVVLALNEFGTSVTGITLGIPKAWSVIRTAEFPTTVRDNLSDVVTYELDRFMPFSPEESIYDYSITGETAEKITVSIAAAKADLVNGYIEALKEAGIAVSRLTLNLSAIGALCRCIGKTRNILFIGADSGEYEGALFTDSSVAEVAGGRFAAGDDDKARVEMISSDMRSMIDHAKRRDSAPHLFALINAESAALRERLRTLFPLPATLLDEVDVGFGVPFGQRNIPYAAAGGVLESLQPGTQKMNLLTKGRHERPKIPFRLTIVLTVFLAALWVVYAIAPIELENKRLAVIERQIKSRRSGVTDLESLKKEIDTLNGEIETIRQFKEGGTSTLTILKELTLILPKSVWLTRLRITQSTVEIEGYSSSASELLSLLEASKHLTKAEFASPTFRDIRMNADRFNIKMEIRGAKEEKGARQKNEKK